LSSIHAPFFLGNLGDGHPSPENSWNTKKETARAANPLKGMNHLRMQKETKSKQIVIRFDPNSYAKISDFAKAEHRGLGEFVRHAALHYIEQSEQSGNSSNKKGGAKP